jgi:hypothetical protein
MECDQRLADRDERSGIRACSRLLAQGHDRKEAQDTHGDEDAFDDTGSDLSEGEDFVDSLEDGPQHDGGADVGDDEDQLQERAKGHASVGACTYDVAGIVHHRGVEDKRCGDRGVMYVLTNNTPVTSAILLCELNWPPFLHEVNDSRLPTDVVASPTLVERHAPTNLSPLLPAAGTRASYDRRRSRIRPRPD